MTKEEARNIVKTLRKKYELKANVPFAKLPIIMTPMDYQNFMKAIQLPNGTPIPSHLKEVSKDKMRNLQELFKPRIWL